MKKKLANLCDALMNESEKIFGHWDITIGLFLMFFLGCLSFFFQAQIPSILFVYLQYKFWSTLFFFISLKLEKKGHNDFGVCTIAVLVQMLDVAVLLGYLYCLKNIFFPKDSAPA